MATSAPGRIDLVGFEELKARITALPFLVTYRLREHARGIAGQIRDRAKQLVPFDTGTTHDSIAVRADEPNKQYIVGVFEAPAHRAHERTANFEQLPFWLEYGTIKMPPRPFMRPAADEFEEAYTSGIERILEDILE
jgi:HK97 gp10 family phage protein